MDGAEEVIVASGGFKVEDGVLEIHQSDSNPVIHVPLIAMRKYIVRR